jgi:hypothetical protein
MTASSGPSSSFVANVPVVSSARASGAMNTEHIEKTKARHTQEFSTFSPQETILIFVVYSPDHRWTQYRKDTMAVLTNSSLRIVRQGRMDIEAGVP